MSAPYATPMDFWRILLLQSSGNELLVSNGEASGLRFPHACTPGNERTAPYLNAELRRRWRFRTISLCELPGIVGGNCDFRYQLMQIAGRKQPAPSGFEWAGINALAGRGFVDARDSVAASQVHALCSSGPGRRLHAFDRPGWFGRLVGWMQPILRSHGLTWNGRFQQLTASPDFALIRFETGQSAVWFKAVGPPNSCEFAITLCMATLSPAFVPEILASHKPWNGWLSMEAGDHTLARARNPQEWRRAAAALAEMQLASLGKTDELMDLGARDLRTDTLLDCCDSVFAVFQRLMRLQQKCHPPALKPEEVRCLRDEMASALSRLRDASLPPTIAHLDCNPGNIALSSERVTFLDWAEAGVGIPFLTFEYLLEHFRRAFPAAENEAASLTAAYTVPWLGVLQTDQIEIAARFAPAAAAFAYATSFITAAKDSDLEAPHISAILRSLARRISLELQKSHLGQPATALAVRAS